MTLDPAEAASICSDLSTLVNLLGIPTYLTLMITLKGMNRCPISAVKYFN
jgi:hypothetical protein